MIEKIDKKVVEEVEKLLTKKDLETNEIEILLAVKNDLKSEEKMKRMIEITTKKKVG